MGFISSLKGTFKSKKNKYPQPEALNDYCPNCWGREEYGGKFYQVAKSRGIDVNSKEPQQGWIKEYADNHLSHLKLKKHADGLICEGCKLNYTEK
jgi:hypothetical protein